MAARLFLRLSIVRIIAWTVNGGSTPMIGPIILVKEDAALRVDVLIVRSMCVAPAPLSIAVCVTASFMARNANVIMKSASNVKPSKPVSSVKPNTQSFATDVTGAGTPNAQRVRNGYPSRTINVTFSQ